MPKRYTVQEGDHLGWIAAQNGFKSTAPIWSAKENAVLRARRPNPNQLAPGDEIVIPDRTFTSAQYRTGRRYEVVVPNDELWLRVYLSDIFDVPIAIATGSLTVGSATLTVTTDGNGLFEAQIPLDARNASLDIDDWHFEFVIGGLQPKGELQGQTARYRNLGIWRGHCVDFCDPDATALAIELLQERQGQVATGEDDGTLADQLAAAHDEVH